MADQERRTTTSTTSVPPGTHSTKETTRRGGMPSAIWLILGAVVAVLLILYLFNFMGDGGEGDTTGATVDGAVTDGATETIEGTPDVVEVPGDAVVVPPAEAPSN